MVDFTKTSAFEREKPTRIDKRPWANPSISGVNMYVRSVAGLGHAYIIPSEKDVIFCNQTAECGTCHVVC